MYDCRESCSEFHIRSLASGFGDIHVLLTAKKCVAVFNYHSTEFLVEKQMLDMTELNDEEVTVYMFEPNRHQLSCVAIGVIGTLVCNLEEKRYEYIDGNKKDVSGVLLDCWKTNCELAFLYVSTEPAVDYAACIKCLDWPIEGESWINRDRRNGWPNEETIKKIVNTGCHFVPARCEGGDMQWRLSFVRAETFLMNSWTTTQHIVYHMLRYFGDVAIVNAAWGNEERSLLNYYIKTLMLWECELNPSDWWNGNSCLHLYSYLLQKLRLLFENKRCPNYFIESIDMFNQEMKETRYYEVMEKLEKFGKINPPSDWIKENYFHKRRRHITQYFVKLLSNDDDLQCLEMYSRHGLDQELAIKTLGERHTSVRHQLESYNKEALFYLALLDKITQVKDDAKWIYALLDLSWNQSSKHHENGMLKTKHFVILELPKHMSTFVTLTRTLCYSSLWYFVNGESLLTIGGSTINCFSAVLLKLCEELFERSLQTKDEFSESIHNRSSIYLAAIDFATKRYELSWTYCALVISNIKIAKITQLQTLNIPSLLFLEDVSTIVGFAYLFKFQKIAKGVKMKRFSDKYLQTSLDFFAHYLAFTSQTFHLDMTKHDCSNSLRMRSEFPMEELFVHLWSYKYKKFLDKQRTITNSTKDELTRDAIKFRSPNEAKNSMLSRKLSVECLQKLQSAMSFVDKILSHFEALRRCLQRQFQEVRNLCMPILYQEAHWSHAPNFGLRFDTMVYSRSIDSPCLVVLDNSAAFLNGLILLIVQTRDYHRIQADLKAYGQRNAHLRRRIYNLMGMPTKSTYYRKYEKLKMWQHLMGMRTDQPH